MLRVSEIKLTIHEDEHHIKEKLIQKLKIKASDLISYRIYKQSVDARKKDMLYFVYTVDARVKDQESVLKRVKHIQVIQEDQDAYQAVEGGDQHLAHRPLIIGSGPCGLFAALILAQRGYKPLVIERGKKVDERAKDVDLFWEQGILNPNSNVQFGEGGAGTFSDGKLTTQIKNLRCRKVLEEFVQAGAPEDILYKQKPHVGTDILRGVVANIRETIISLGGAFCFNTTVTDIELEETGQGKLIKGVRTNTGKFIPADVVVLAVGHSARDTFEMLHKNKVQISQKAFSIGVRIEHPQKLINGSQYGKFADHPRLGAAEYKLSHRAKNGRGVYTFCMCPGGMVVGSSSEEGGIVTNGMSEHKRDQPNANSAILVNIGPADYNSPHPLAGMYMQRRYEQMAFELVGKTYHAPAQLVGDFMAGEASTKAGKIKPSYLPSVTWTDLASCLPDFAVEALREGIVAFNRKLRGFSDPQAVMTGPETRSSSPIRIDRTEDYESNVKGLYPAGEGAGYAGGITSAAVDGIQVAEAIIARYTTP